MKYAGMPWGMWALFAASFRRQLTAVFGYDEAEAGRISCGSTPSPRAGRTATADIRKRAPLRVNNSPPDTAEKSAASAFG